MKSNMTRRAMLASAPMAIAGASSVAALPSNENEDPHPAWLEAFTATVKALENVEEDSEEDKHLWAEHYRIEDLICETPATTVSGLAAQLEFLAREGKDYWCCPSHEKLAEGMVRTAKHLAG